MPKLVKPLTALEVGRLKTQGFYAVGTVSGLYLNVGANPEARSWILRVRTATGRRELGLGAYPAIRLAQAHELATVYKEKIAQGIDPVAEKALAKQSLLQSSRPSLTFQAAATHYFDAKSPEWRSSKHRHEWLATLTLHAFPIIGAIPVADITRWHVLAVLNPLWHQKTQTASRLRGTLERILDYAQSLGHRTGDNPALWKGGLNAVLAKPSKISSVVHYAALEHRLIGQLMAQVRLKTGMAARCLEFTVLSACRSAEVRGAVWAEFDCANALWTIPAVRMKAAKTHTVPLSRQALRLLNALALARPADALPSDYVFMSAQQRQLSPMTLTALLRRMGQTSTVHGFRSTFRDWAADCTQFDRATCEQALAHQLPDKVEAAYLRTHLVAKRRVLMQAWADRCDDLEH